jgi:uncharacterized protein (TIGR02265 family)
VADFSPSHRATTREEARVTASVFEGMYLKGLHADAALTAKLREAGFDPNRMEPAYPPEVMDRCLEAAADHLYPGQPRAEAYRRLGERFVAGFRETLVGSVIMAVFPVLGADRLLGRVAKSYGVGQNYGSASLVPLDRQHYRFEYRNGFHGVSANFEFTRGVFEAILRYARVEPKIEGRVIDDGFDLDIRW